MRLPIGIQDFPKIRETDYIYVDKTMYLTDFLRGGSFFFARPRRFGKSLLVSTLKTIFEGHGALFTGLWLENKHDFKVRPVIRLDFSRINFTTKPLDESIVDSLRQTAALYGYALKSTVAQNAFEELILELSKTERVVVLIDEYDQPLTETLNKPEQYQFHSEILKSVYGILKPLDEYLHLVWITGVSKIGKLSLFSSLNSIQDISLNPKYAMLCGYSKNEIEQSFMPHLENAKKQFGTSLETLWEGITHWYNGYSWDGINRLYCPFSFLLFLEHPAFKSYWYETGTPTWLIEMIKEQQLNPLTFELISTDSASLVTTDIDNLEPIGLMFQTGYLTIQTISNMFAIGVEYSLGYPNQEVRVAFSKGLLEVYSRLSGRTIGGFSIDLYKALIRLDWEALFARANQVLASIPYEIFARQEIYVNSLWHLMLASTGLRTSSQVQNALGRMDTLLETNTHFIIFELKIGGTPEIAIAQAKNSQYAKGLEGKPVILVGLVFDLHQKSISAWEVSHL